MNKLFKIKKKNSGRSNGRISVRHIGNKHKKFYRLIDFKREKQNIPAKIFSFNYDPNRNVEIAFIKYYDGECCYILKTQEMKINDLIINNKKLYLNNSGNSTILKNIQIGSFINCVSFKKNTKAIFARSSGVFCELLSKDEKYALIRLPSFKKKKISLYCVATIGKIFNVKKKKMYKAGQKRWKGIRPTVRGVAMNPVDHPLGGGEGKTSGGRHPCSPFGKKSKGLKTKK